MTALGEQLGPVREDLGQQFRNLAQQFKGRRADSLTQSSFDGGDEDRYTDGEIFRRPIKNWIG